MQIKTNLGEVLNRFLEIPNSGTVYFMSSGVKHPEDLGGNGYQIFFHILFCSLEAFLCT